MYAFFHYGGPSCTCEFMYSYFLNYESNFHYCSTLRSVDIWYITLGGGVPPRHFLKEVTYDYSKDPGRRRP